MTSRGGGPDAIEARDLDYHEAVYRAFLDIARANPHRCVVLDASAAPDVVAHTAMTEIARRFEDVR
jgi:dTMP kinase